jgi:hypothetical protein
MAMAPLPDFSQFCSYEPSAIIDGLSKQETYTAPMASRSSSWNRCTCRGRCKGHSLRKQSEAKAEQDLMDLEEDAWPPPYPRSYDQDFRAPLDVPLDHITYTQEAALRRCRIIALNRAMKLCDERSWRAYVLRMCLLRCVDCRYVHILRSALLQFRDAASRLGDKGVPVTVPSRKFLRSITCDPWLHQQG